MNLKALFLAGCALSLLPLPVAAQAQEVASQATDAAEVAAPLEAFVSQIDIPHSEFTLDNGLTVIVHTDRTTPEVSIGIWYDVGSKNEPEGRSGFAHLFEHLMFNGSENVPGDFFKPLEEAGATGINGTTSYDRTNYYETVPVSALERALFMESDRMGYLLGAVTQEVLDEQRGVVQNEKRQGDDNPYSVINDRLITRLYPADHPYGHSVIGSMADLDAATLADVRDWFRKHYGPNNAILVLTGDIDEGEGRRLVTKYFGAIPRGPENPATVAPVPTLPERIDETVTAPVTQPTIVRAWAVPGYDDTEALGLDIVAGVMGQIDNSLLERVLVRERKLFDFIGTGNSTLARGGTFTIRGQVADGVDPALAGKALDEMIAEFMARTPTQDEVTRWVTPFVVGYAMGQESLASRGEALATGKVLIGDAGAYRRDIDFYAKQTPQNVIATARKWLTRPVYALTVVPGARIEEEGAAARPGTPTAATPSDELTQVERKQRMPMPPLGEPSGTRFPEVTRAALSNGIEVIYAQKDTVPFTQILLSFPAGTAVDAPSEDGLFGMMIATLDQGIPGRDSASIEAEKERLGLSLGGGATVDESSLYVRAPSINLAPALDLMGSVVKEPTFPQDEIDRIRRDYLARYESSRILPDALVQEVLPGLIDANSPYAIHNGIGDPAVLASITPAQLDAAHDEWVRPEGARIFVVSDLPLAQLQPQLEEEFGTWEAAGTPPPMPTRAEPDPASPQIVLIDRVDSAQTTIAGGQLVEGVTSDDLVSMDLANQVLGSGFLSRINMNLREDKHWAYGASGSFVDQLQETSYVAATSVQQDKAGPAVGELRKEVMDFVTTRPISQEELNFVRDSRLRSMSSWFNSAGGVLAGMQENVRRGRPDDYYSTLGEQYKAVTLDEVRTDMNAALAPSQWVWVVVGDADIVKPQLEPLGLPITVLKPEDVLPPFQDDQPEGQVDKGN
ncbi:M16 family metallopeptidase [Alteriqipengyuania sp. 357]